MYYYAIVDAKDGVEDSKDNSSCVQPLEVSTFSACWNTKYYFVKSFQKQIFEEKVTVRPQFFVRKGVELRSHGSEFGHVMTRWR